MPPPAGKKAISAEAWDAKLAAVKVAKEDMNRLVMNFLVTEGYVDAARTFEQESGTPPGVELGSITDRMEIRKAVQSGQVEEAISRVNDLNPEILEEQAPLLFHLQQQRLIELIRAGQTEAALSFATEYLAPHGEENEAFLEELERTVALLAFGDDARRSPVGELMDVAQRQKTASELNAAILSSQGQEREPRLLLLLKMMLWAQAQLDERAAYPRIADLATAALTPPGS
ncbi:GID8 [Scenedesmus sp. PABB004]|nr:GID8 [Scenedesmus sp. PABB004]